MSLLEVPVSFSAPFTKLLAKRGLTDPEKIETFIQADLARLSDPFLMKGMREAVARIQKAVRQHEKIFIHGDYDVDGITGAAIVARTLAALQAEFSVFLPERSRDGYGVSEQALRDAHAKGVSLVITVDCGISARDEIQAARSLGLDVIVIDHHRLPADGLPPATVILNPLQEDCSYPFKELSAGGLAFKLSQALIGEDAFKLLDLAALSTVCDVAPLREENRIIVKNGLKKLSSRETPGIKALAEVAGIKTREMTAMHIGFMLGPRINAAGRMSSAEIALRLLLTDSVKEAESLAQILQEENKMRQKEERQLVKEAIEEVERSVNFNRDRVIVIARRGWHAGVIGIVASRLVEKYHRPAVVIAIEENGRGKGSGRSIKKFHLFNAFEAAKDHLEEYGGHEQAAGLSILEEKLPAFRKQINQHAIETYAPETFVKKVPVDLDLKLEDLRTNFIQELKLLEPLGAGNPRPVFLTENLEIKTKPQPMPSFSKGSGSQTLKLCVTDGFLTYEAEWNDRSGTLSHALEMGTKIDLAYSVKMKTWDGIESLILEAKEIRPRS